MTDALHREGERHALSARRVHIQDTFDVAPGVRRVVLSGPQLRGWRSSGPDDHVKLLLPGAAGASEVRRDLTPLPLDPGQDGETRLALDVVLHGQEAPLSGWATRVRAGEDVGLGGPRGSRGVPLGMQQLVLLVDATALPAAARWLAMSSPRVPVCLLSTAPAAMAEPYLSPVLSDRGSVSALYDLAEDAVVEALLGLGSVGPMAFVFAAGEASMLIPARRHLRDERGLRPDQLSVSGYWRRGTSDFDHHAPLDPEEQR